MFSDIPDEVLFLILSFLDVLHPTLFISKRFWTVALDCFKRRYQMDDFRIYYTKDYEHALLKKFSKTKEIKYGFDSCLGYLFLKKLLRSKFSIKGSIYQVEKRGFACVLTNNRFFCRSQGEIQYFSPICARYRFFIENKMQKPKICTDPDAFYESGSVRINEVDKCTISELCSFADFGDTKVYLLKSISKQFITSFLLFKLFGYWGYDVAEKAFKGILFEGTEIFMERRSFYKEFFYTRCKVSIEKICKRVLKIRCLRKEFLKFRDIFFCKENIDFFMEKKKISIRELPVKNEHEMWNLSLDEIFWFILVRTAPLGTPHTDLPDTDINGDVYNAIAAMTL